MSSDARQGGRPRTPLEDAARAAEAIGMSLERGDLKGAAMHAYSLRNALNEAAKERARDG